MKLKLLSVFALMTLCYFSCGKKETIQQESIRPVKVTVVESRSEIRKEFSGVVDPAKFVNLAFRVLGEIQEIPVVEGQNVKKGDLIAEVFPREINLQYEAAKANFETRRAILERTERLLKSHAVSVQEYEIARASYQDAKSAFENQSNNLVDTRLYAPFTGSIAERKVEKHQRINPGQTIVTLIDPTQIQILFTAPDNYISYLESADKSFYVEFGLEKGRLFSAELKEYVDASPDGTGIPVYLKITDPSFSAAKMGVKPGFACNVTMNIKSNDKLGNLPFLPLSALLGAPNSDQKYVWVLNPDTNTVTKRAVHTGSLVDSSNIIITDGLKAGDIVITAGVTQITEGERVRILK